jgi:hypothetical protein
MRRKLRDLEEVERMAEIERTELRAPTQSDIRKLELKKLGRTWGKPRKRMEGWPK